MNILNSKSLLNYNTFKVNSIAEFFINIKNTDEVLALLEEKKINGKEIFILGGGSNILFTKNITGLVIHNQIKGINIVSESKDDMLIEIGAGEVWNDLVNWSTKRNLYGIENLSLIPGYVGAAPIQNIGAYGTEIRDVFEELESINLHTKEKTIFNKLDCKFGYRDSIFKNKVKGEFIITKIKIKLYKTRKINLSYKTLKEKIEKLKLQTLTSKSISDTVVNIRNSKLPNPKKIGNAGSFFKNPTIKKETLERLKKEYPNIPFFKKTQIKISAGWLIEQSNWKGYKNKTCGVYNKQSLVLINHSNATGKQIKNLSEKIKQDVHKKFNILLEEEVLII